MTMSRSRLEIGLSLGGYGLNYITDKYTNTQV